MHNESFLVAIRSIRRQLSSPDVVSNQAFSGLSRGEKEDTPGVDRGTRKCKFLTFKVTRNGPFRSLERLTHGGADDGFV